MQLRLITRDHVQQFLAAKLRSGLAWKTVKNIRTTFGTVMGAAEFADLIEHNPVRKTRLPRRGPVVERPAIEPEVICNLLDSLSGSVRSLAWLLAITGLRIGELLALRWKDVDLNVGIVRVRRSVYDGHFDEPKTKTSNRAVPLGPKGIAILQAHRPGEANPEALVFATRSGKPLSRRNLLKRHLKPAAKRLGIAGASWHWLRHANATMLDAVGTPLGTVQALLGHSSPDVTREVYLHSIAADARKAVEKVENLLIGPKRTQIVEIQNPGLSLIQ